MRQLIIISLLFSLFGFASAQDKKIDKLELLYQQENYNFAAKQAHKLIHKKGYANSTEAHLFLYLSLQHMHNEGWNIHKRFKPIEQTIEHHKNTFAQLDKDDKVKNKYVAYFDEKPVKQTTQVSTGTVTTNKTSTTEKTNTTKRVEYSSSSKTSITKRDSIVDFAKNYLNSPYRYGGRDEKGFDCSGFTCFVLNNHGIQTARSSGEIGKQSERIAIEEAQKGDLLFFGKNQNSIHHVGIVISEVGEPLTMIHSSTSSGVIITVVPESDYWTRLLQYAGRVVN
jgi:peptidoglycan DL-endopeptidase CwlO